jgi:signal transduction histidine kinase
VSSQQEPAARRTTFSRVVNLMGAAVVMFYVIVAYVNEGLSEPTAGMVLVIVSILLWALAMVIPDRHERLIQVLLVAMVLLGAAATWSSNGLSLAPVLSGIVQLTVRGRSMIPGYVTAGAAGVIVAGLVIVQHFGGHRTFSIGTLLAMEAAILVTIVGRTARRQVQQREVMEREAAALADRQALARDLHDVLAHSLGGLVIQLDATDAQLEAGQVEKARARLVDARGMAASGLAEARRAVEALRSPSPAAAGGPGGAAGEIVAGGVVAEQLGDLVDAHVRLGGEVRLDVVGTPGDVDSESATALRRALQESLSNARKHAPGKPVVVGLTWTRDTVELTVTNPLAEPTGGSEGEASGRRMLATSGAGRGLIGMQERFDSLPGGSASAGVRGGDFEVRAKVRVEATR